MENEKALYFLMVILYANGGSMKISIEDAAKLFENKSPLRIIQRKVEEGIELVLENCDCPKHGGQVH